MKAATTTNGQQAPLPEGAVYPIPGAENWPYYVVNEDGSWKRVYGINPMALDGDEQKNMRDAGLHFVGRGGQPELGVSWDLYSCPYSHDFAVVVLVQAVSTFVRLEGLPALLKFVAQVNPLLATLTENKDAAERLTVEGF